MLRLGKAARLGFVLALTVLLGGMFGIAPAMARPAEPERADVRVMVVQAPPVSEDLLTYTIKAMNRGDSVAYYAQLKVSYDATALKLMDVQFSGAPAWVIKSETGAFQIQTQRLNSSGGATIATARFTPLKENAQLTERVTYKWADAFGSKSSRSNLPLSAELQPYATLTHQQTSDQHFFSANLFLPGEPVVFWYHLPDGTVVPTEVKKGVIIDAASTDAKDKGADYAVANADGAINLRFSTHHLAAGEYTMIARGDISGFTAVGHCALR